MDTQALQTEIVELIKGINEEDKLLELKAHVEDLKTEPWWLHDKEFMKELKQDVRNYEDGNVESFDWEDVKKELKERINSHAS